MSRPHHVVALLALSITGACAVVMAHAGTASEQEDSPVSAESRAGTGQTTSTPQQASVFFVTNRNRKKTDKPEVRFGGKRGVPAFGICEVEFEPIPMMSEVADKAPFYVPAESSEQRLEIVEEAETFWHLLVDATAATRTGDVVIFVHGYSYDLERGCDRAAEAQRILVGEATILLLTWPSNGRPTDYSSDRKDLEWSIPFLQEMLRELTGRLGAGNVQVLAHSLGSKGIMEALVGLAEEGVDEPLMSQLVLLAPDVDSEVFLERLPELSRLSGDITLYASSNDTPLKFSRKVNGSPRLGQAGKFLTVTEGLETVDVTPAGRYQYTGHEYFYFHPLVVSDLLELVTTRGRAAQRSAPQPRSRDGLAYWEIVAEEKR